MMTPGQMAERLLRAAARADVELTATTEALMVLVESQAREVIGTYTYGWPVLAESTQEDRVKQGYPADEPLLRTGELAASIAHKVEDTGRVIQGLVYSDDIVALWQEMGTSRGIPPRSFLMGSLVRAVPEMGRIFGQFAERLLAGV